ncbi:MAG: MOSC domain-containing protein [Rhodanobacter sp.]
MSMTLISVNVAMPAAVARGDSIVMTGIFKRPVAGAVAVRKLNLDGDGQADLVNHGGESKAVYAYALEHYDYWQEALGRPAMPHGQFGENLTIAGLDEALLCVGDHLAIGEALLAITQPRVPCFKLGIRLGDKTMPRRFAESLRTGCYLRVLREGLVAAGDQVRLVLCDSQRLSIRSLFDAYLKPNDADARGLLKQALEVRGLSPEWRRHITSRLARRH